MSSNRHQATRASEIGGRFDPWLLTVSALLLAFGVVMVASSSVAVGEGLAVGPFHFLIKHLAFVGGGIVLAAWMMRTELKKIESRDRLLLLGCVLLLLAVLVPGIGHKVNGARRWISLGISNFQVVEAVKLMYLVWLASYLVRFRDAVNATWPAMLKPLGVVAVLGGLLLVQPDMGSATLLFAITVAMLFIGGVHLPRMAPLLLGGMGVLALLVIFEPYRMRRFTSFMDPWADPFNSGYQLTNALMAIGRGGWLGVGLGGSVQKLAYLPEAHTDFILAVIAEELGFAGVLAVVGLYAALVWRAFAIGSQAVRLRRHFAGYLAFGVGLTFALQSLISIGVNLGLLPTKGLTLPLISSGGSSVLMSIAALGLLLRVSYEVDRAARQAAYVRAEVAQPGTAAPPPVMAQPAPAALVPLRSMQRLRQRLAARFGRQGGEA